MSPSVPTERPNLVPARAVRGEERTPCCRRESPRDDRAAEIGGDLWRSSGPTCPLRQAHVEHIARDHVQLALLKTSRNGDSTSSLGNLCQRSITLTANKSCLMLRRNLPLVFQFLHTGPVPGNGRAPLPAHSPLTYLYSFMRSALTLLFSRLNSVSSFHLSSDGRCSRPFAILVEPSAGPSAPAPSLSSTGDSKTAQSTPGVASAAGLSRGQESPPSICWQHFSNAVQDTSSRLCYKDTVLDRVQLGVRQDPHVLFCRAAFQPVGPQHVLVHRVGSSCSGGGLCTSPY